MTSRELYFACTFVLVQAGIATALYSVAEHNRDLDRRVTAIEEARAAEKKQKDEDDAAMAESRRKLFIELGKSVLDSTDRWLEDVKWQQEMAELQGKAAAAELAELDRLLKEHKDSKK